MPRTPKSRRRHRTKSLLDTIEQTIRRAPDDHLRKGQYNGKTTGLSLSSFIWELLNSNEARPDPLTNDDILVTIGHEFGTDIGMLKRISEHKDAFGTYRSAYNLGSLNAGRSPAFLCSFRYNKAGLAVRERREAPLSLDQARAYSISFDLIDPRIFTPEEIDLCLRRQEEGVEGYEDIRLPTEKQVSDYPYRSIELSGDTTAQMTWARLELHMPGYQIED